jgi:hypothetical protein
MNSDSLLGFNNEHVTSALSNQLEEVNALSIAGKAGVQKERASRMCHTSVNELGHAVA